MLRDSRRHTLCFHKIQAVQHAGAPHEQSIRLQAQVEGGQALLSRL